VEHPEYTTQAMRHLAASLWFKAGATPFPVMKAGGSSSTDMVSTVSTANRRRAAGGRVER
jgi:hypothetical protein